MLLLVVADVATYGYFSGIWYFVFVAAAAFVKKKKENEMQQYRQQKWKY